jgi:hypothetical protein
MAQQTLNAGSPPIVWSTVEDAFTKINANFDEIYATIGGTLGSVVDFETLNSDVSPAITETYDLGSPSFRWRDLYLSGSSLYLGTAQITASLAGIVNLPAGSTVGGELIRNPLESSFKTVAVSGQDSVVADDTTDTLNLVSGNAGLSITTNALTDTVTFTSNAVNSVVGTVNQIGVSTVSGTATLTNLGVLSLTGEAGGIGVSGTGVGNITLTNLGTKRIIAGTGMSVNPLGGTGNVTVTNEGALTSFNRVLVNGDAGNVLAADGSVSILRINSGVGVSLTKDPTTDTITISANTDFDVTGSVFGDDSTVMVDALEYKIYARNGFYGDLHGSIVSDNSTMLIDGVDGRIVGDVYTSTLRTTEASIYLGFEAGSTSTSNYTVGIGYQAQKTNPAGYTVGIGSYAGRDNQSQAAVAIGSNSGETSQGDSAVALGVYAGQTSQGTNAIAIGNQAGKTNQPAGSIVINASGIVLNGSAAGFYVDPIREVTGPQTLYYDPSNKEVTWGPVPAGGGGGGGDFEFSVAGDDSTQRIINSGETLRFAGAGGITITTDGEGRVTITGPSLPSLGSITFAGTTIDSSDSSGIVFTPAVLFNSDIVVENELTVNNSATVSGTLTVNNLNVTGAITSQGSGTPEIFSDNEVLLTAGTRVEISSSPLKMASFTTSDRDLLTAINGDVIYNITLNKFQGYANGGWVDFH